VLGGDDPAFEEHDVVRLVPPLPEHGLPAGATGAVVHVYDDPSEAYEVEFIEPDGNTIALVTVRPDELELVERPSLSE
jgi:hypothetical protein